MSKFSPEEIETIRGLFFQGWLSINLVRKMFGLAEIRPDGHAFAGDPFAAVSQ